MIFSKYAHIASLKRNAKCTRIFEILLLCWKQAFCNVSVRKFWLIYTYMYVYCSCWCAHSRKNNTLYVVLHSFPDLIKQKFDLSTWQIGDRISHSSYCRLQNMEKSILFIWTKWCNIWTSIFLTQIIIKWTQSILWSYDGNWQPIANFHIALESFQ